MKTLYSALAGVALLLTLIAVGPTESTPSEDCAEVNTSDNYSSRTWVHVLGTDDICEIDGQHIFYARGWTGWWPPLGTQYDVLCGPFDSYEDAYEAGQAWVNSQEWPEDEGVECRRRPSKGGGGS